MTARGRLVFALIFFMLYGALALEVVIPKSEPTGDEPHYLMIAHSLSVDSDIAVLNNYRNKDYHLFYKTPLARRATFSADGKRGLPAVAIGTGLFLTPFYRIALSEFPFYLVRFLRLLICAVAAAGLYQLMKLGSSFQPPKESLYCISAGAALASPLITYSSQFYPEILAFLLLVIGLNQLQRLQSSIWLPVMMLSLVPGLLVWLHPKYLVIGFLLFVLTQYSMHRYHRNLFTARGLHILFTATGVLLYFLFLHSEYGSWSPSRIYGMRTHENFLSVFGEEPAEYFSVAIRMFFGFWIDQRFGLLPFAPFYVAFFPALLWNLRKDRAKLWPYLLLFAFHLGVLCWSAPLGGYAPPGRHFVVMIPLLFIPILKIYPQWSVSQKRLFWSLQVAALYITVRMFLDYKKIFTNVTWKTPDGLSPFWKSLHLSQWIPSLTAISPDYFLILIWVLIACALSFLLYPRHLRAIRSVI